MKLQPEDISNSEIGLKGNAANGRVSFEATYFHMTENGVVLSQRQGPFFFPTNAGELRYDGVETGLSVDITPKVSAFVNASFYHSRFGEFVIESEDGDQVLTGNGLPIAPDYVVNWGASFRPTPSVDATVNIKSTSAMEANRENTFRDRPVHAGRCGRDLAARPAARDARGTQPVQRGVLLERGRRNGGPGETQANPVHHLRRPEVTGNRGWLWCKVRSCRVAVNAS